MGLNGVTNTLRVNSFKGIMGTLLLRINLVDVECLFADATIFDNCRLCVTIHQNNYPRGIEVTVSE